MCVCETGLCDWPGMAWACWPGILLPPASPLAARLPRCLATHLHRTCLFFPSPSPHIWCLPPSPAHAACLPPAYFSLYVLLPCSTHTFHLALHTHFLPAGTGQGHCGMMVMVIIHGQDRTDRRQGQDRDSGTQDQTGMAAHSTRCAATLSHLPVQHACAAIHARTTTSALPVDRPQLPCLPAMPPPPFSHHHPYHPSTYLPSFPSLPLLLPMPMLGMLPACCCCC